LEHRPATRRGKPRLGERESAHPGTSRQALSVRPPPYPGAVITRLSVDESVRIVLETAEQIVFGWKIDFTELHGEDAKGEAVTGALSELPRSAA